MAPVLFTAQVAPFGKDAIETSVPRARTPPQVADATLDEENQSLLLRC